MQIAGIDYVQLPLGPDAEGCNSQDPLETGPTPGWHAVSTNTLHSYSKEYTYLLNFDPVDMVGYSIYIYCITRDEANRVRRELGLPELTGSRRPTEGVADEQVP